jgi:hypothetical protein
VQSGRTDIGRLYRNIHGLPGYNSGLAYGHYIAQVFTKPIALKRYGQM